MKNRTKKNIIISAIVSLVLVSLFACMGIKSYNDKKNLKVLKVENIDFKKVRDGEYPGKYNLYINSARVVVLVKDGILKRIDILRHYHGPGYGADRLTQEIIIKQTLEVDAVSGATKSSFVLKKAVENALKQGLTN